MVEMKLKSAIKKLLPQMVTEQVAGVRFRFKVRFWKKIGTMTDEQFLNYVVNGYCKKHPEEHRENVFKLVNERENCSFETDQKRIVFVAEHVTGRLLKVASALHKCGWEIDFLCGYNSQYINVSNDDFKTCCERIIYYDTFFELAYYLLVTDAAIVHYFTTWWSCFEACIILKHKVLFPKIVVERYDIANGLVKPETFKGCRQEKSIYRCEQFAFEHADGVIQREFSFEYLEKQLHFKLPQNKLIFFEYIEKGDIKGDNCENDNLTICYVGGIGDESNEKNACNPRHTRVAELCRKNKCHYHMYPSKWDEKVLKNYISLEKKNQYFHLHQPLPYKDLIDEIAQYDFGIFPISAMFEDTHADFGENYREKIIYAGTNKFFDYIAAGLPIIAATPILLSKEMERDGFLKRWAIEEIDFDYLRDNKMILRQRLLEKREKWTMEYNIDRLEQFYNSVMDVNFLSDFSFKADMT